MDDSKIKEEVWKTIQDLNRAWIVEGNADKLKDYFHNNMIAITPTNNECLEGRDACIASWKAFVDSTRINHWKEIDPKIHVYGGGHFSVVTYYYDMSFEMYGQTVKVGGRDMFALVKENGRWWVVADHFSSFPQQ